MRIARDEDYGAAYKSNLLKIVEADGAIIAGQDAEPLEGYYRVAVYAMSPEKMKENGNTGWKDMHFARENAGGV